MKRGPGSLRNKLMLACALTVAAVLATPAAMARDYRGHRDDSGKVLGALVVGAVIGGVLGNTVGKGDGRKAATVGGAVAGGVIGNQVGKRNDGGGTAWRIVVRLDDGQYATVTQRENPGVRSGDYVQVSNGRVYTR